MLYAYDALWSEKSYFDSSNKNKLNICRECDIVQLQVKPNELVINK